MTGWEHYGMTAPLRHAGLDPASPLFRKSKRTRSRIGTLRDDRMGALRDDMSGVVNRMTAPSCHPDVLLVRIPVFAKNGTDMKRFVSPHFRSPLLVSEANSRRFFLTLTNNRSYSFVYSTFPLF